MLVSLSLPDPATPAISFSQDGGPQFGKDPETPKAEGINTPVPIRIFPKNTKARFILIALAVLALSVIWVRSSRPSGILAHLAQQTSAPSSTFQNATTRVGSETTGITLELKNDGITAELPHNQIDVITEQARRGDSITRLARRALAEHLQNQSLSLTPEQRVYAEDFIQKATGENALPLGQKLSFPTQLLDAAIQKAQKLSPYQLQNLSRYSKLVQNW